MLLSMEFSESMPIRATRRAAEDGGLDLCIFYRDIDSAARAAALTRRLTRHLEGEPETQTRFWSFEILRLADALESAREDIMASDMILIAPGTSGSAPEALRQILQASLAARAPGSTAVVALFDSSSEQASLDSFLALVCREHGHAYFSTRPVSGATELTAEQVRHRASASSAVLDSIMQRSLGHDYPRGRV